MNLITNVLPTQRPRVVTGLTPYAGSFGRTELIHLLNRTLFGVKQADIDYFEGQSLQNVIETLIVPPTAAERKPSPPINTYNTAAKPDPRIYAGDTWVYDQENGNFNGERRASLRYWWGGQMINQNRTIFEKMVLFWHNHFSMEAVDTSALYAYSGQLTLRDHALGNFSEFVKAITFEPQMLRYLNGYLNSKAAPDENYGRELMELFTLGKGEASRYTEDDVKAAARVFTGWKVRQESYRDNPKDTGEPLKYRWVSYFNANTHDTSVKTFSSFFGSKSVYGNSKVNTAANATKEVDDFIHMLFEQEELAKFISRKLYRYFVYYDIDEQTESEVIQPLADIFRQHNFDIIPVLKALLSSAHFFESVNQGCLIKSPIEFCVGIARTFNMEFPEVDTDYVLAYSAWNNIIGTRGAATQGQLIGDPPNVSGWPAYYQEPFYHEAWVNTDTFPKRLRFIDGLLTDNGYSLGGGKKLYINVITFTSGFGDDASYPDTLVDRALELLYAVPVSQKFKDYLRVTILLDGQVSNYYWTDAWDAYQSNPNKTNFNIVNKRLQRFYKFIVDNTEFQLS